jgi:hypothetical protein
MARFAELIDRVRSAVLGSGASTPEPLRAAILARAGVSVGSLAAPPPMPSEVAAFVEVVATQASEIEADDLAALERAGWTQEQIFELTVAAAVGAGVARYQRVQRLLVEEAP